MKKLLIVIAAATLMNSVSATDLSNKYGVISSSYLYTGFTVVGNKACFVTPSYEDDGYTEINRKIDQYDFPSLSYLTSLTLTLGDNDYYQGIDAQEGGLLVSKVNSDSDPTYTDNDDGTVTVTYTDVLTSTSYDSNLIKMNEKVIEQTSSYISYPEYLGYDYLCPDDETAKKAAARVLAKKKGGKKGGGKISCSKIKVLKTRVIK